MWKGDELLAELMGKCCYSLGTRNCSFISVSLELNPFSREWWKITWRGNPRAVCLLLEVRMSPKQVSFCSERSISEGTPRKERRFLPVQQLALVPALCTWLSSAVCCSFRCRTFAERELTGIVWFCCTQILHGLKFCVLKGCVAVRRGKRSRDSWSMGIFVQQLWCA